MMSAICYWRQSKSEFSFSFWKYPRLSTEKWVVSLWTQPKNICEVLLCWHAAPPCRSLSAHAATELDAHRERMRWRTVCVCVFVCDAFGRMCDSRACSHARRERAARNVRSFHFCEFMLFYFRWATVRKMYFWLAMRKWKCKKRRPNRTQKCSSTAFIHFRMRRISGCHEIVLYFFVHRTTTAI